jgi:hypothetical protein
LSDEDTEALTEEGVRLLALLAAGDAFDVRFAPAE